MSNCTLVDIHDMNGECRADFEDLELFGASVDHFAEAFFAGSAWKESDWPVEVYLVR